MLLVLFYMVHLALKLIGSRNKLNIAIAFLFTDKVCSTLIPCKYHV